MAEDPHGVILEWRWPPNSRKAHVFPQGELFSLCGKWAYTGVPQGIFQPAETISKDDCVACDRKARKA